MKKFIIFTNNDTCPDFFITNDGEYGGLLDYAYLFNYRTDSFRVIDRLNFEDAEDRLDPTLYGIYQHVVKQQGVNIAIDSTQFHMLWAFAQCPWITIPPEGFAPDMEIDIEQIMA